MSIWTVSGAVLPQTWALTTWVFGEELNEEQVAMLPGTSMEVSPCSSLYDLHCQVWFVTQQNDSSNICLFTHWNTVDYSTTYTSASAEVVTYIRTEV